MAEQILEPINIAYPIQAETQTEAQARQLLNLKIECNGCKLILGAAQPEDNAAWVSGQSTYQRPPGPAIAELGQRVHIKQEYLRSDLTNLFRVASDSPVLDLRLNKSQPFDLYIQNVGDVGTYQLGGLPLDKLHIVHKLGSADVDFGAENPQASVTELHLNGSASQFEILNLSSSGFQRGVVEGSNNTYHLHFNAPLSRHATLILNAPNSSITLHIPESISACILSADGQAIDTTDIKFSADAGFSKQTINSNEGYYNAAASRKETPRLTIMYDRQSLLNVVSD